MAKAHIQEYQYLAEDSSGRNVQAGKEPAVTTQVVSYTSSTQSSAFNSKTKLIRIIPDADAFLAFGDNPTATANSMFLPSGVAEYFGVGNGDKVAVYDGTT